MSDETIVRKAMFNTRVCTYWLIAGCFPFIFSVVGIPFLLLWFPLGLIFTRRYLESMECVLTEKAVKVKKGILTKVEKTIPLEKITDMGMVQGPIMRHFGVEKLTVETAGTSGPGALVGLTGIVNAKEFREAVLDQRDALAASGSKASSGSPEGSGALAMQGDPSAAVLVEIRDSLQRIEGMMAKGEG